MSFTPPRCPNTRCMQHRAPAPEFYRRHGYYQPKCRAEPVPRFRCLTCGRSFSRQTFRYDSGDHRPDCNEPLLRYLWSGVGLRQAGRQLELDVHSVLGKLRKMGRTFARLHKNLCHRLPDGGTFLLDEEETYEHASIRPLTMPVLIEKDRWFVVATTAGSIRRLAETGTARRLWQDRDEQKHGIRRDHSRRCVKGVLRVLASRLGNEARITLRTDQKASYALIAKEVFGESVRHETTAGTDIRTTFNPLFPINTTLAMTRDNCGRLRRRSWLVTKRAARLRNQLAIFTIYRNYVRRRFNRDDVDETPAKLLGLLPRRLRPAEALAWRQDWGELSIHPMSSCASRTVRDAIAIPA